MGRARRLTHANPDQLNRRNAAPQPPAYPRTLERPRTMTPQSQTAAAPANTFPADSGTPPPRTRYTSPADMFNNASARCPGPPGRPLVRVKSAADWLAEADAAGFTIYSMPAPGNGARYGFTRGASRFPARCTWTTPAAAAEHVCKSILGSPPVVPAQSFYRVAGWLAHLLADKGEAVTLPAAGSHVWGCTTPRLDPDNCPVLISIFEEVQTRWFDTAPNL